MTEEHSCEFSDAATEHGGYGGAVLSVFEKDNGELWVESTMGEYTSRVNYCPFCGCEAENKMMEEDKL